MWMRYCLGEALVVLAELGPLVIVQFFHEPFVRGWRNQFKSASVPVVMSFCRL